MREREEWRMRCKEVDIKDMSRRKGYDTTNNDTKINGGY